jgi:hypothetical protein
LRRICPQFGREHNVSELMKNPRAPLDLKRVKVLPLSRRKNLSTLDKFVFDP